MSADNMGRKLDESEQEQRDALALAADNAREALAALKPFEVHAGRFLPGIEKAVADEVKRLNDVVANLTKIVAAHLGERERPEPTPIAAVLDQQHADAVIAAKAEERAA